MPGKKRIWAIAFIIGSIFFPLPELDNYEEDDGGGMGLYWLLFAIELNWSWE